MNIGILAGGDYDFSVKEYKKEIATWVGVDKGAVRLIKEGIAPFISIGDFDSVTHEEKATILKASTICLSLPEEKDETDTEQALLEVMKRFPNESIYLFGATGGRIDHFLQNFYMMAHPRFRSVLPFFRIIDERNIIFYLLPGTHKIKKRKNKNYVSVFCLVPVSKLTIDGMKYPLTEENVEFVRGFVSNEFEEEEATVYFESGMIAIVLSQD